MTDDPARNDALILFGATGDLAVKKIFPAVYEMAKNGTLGDVPVIGVASRDWTIDQLREHAHDAIAAKGDVDEAIWEDLAGRISYVSGDYRQADTYFGLYQLAEKLVDIDDALAQWRHKHLLTVERIIGMKPGTGGSAGAAYLASTLAKRAFPQLWSLRTAL